MVRGSSPWTWPPNPRPKTRFPKPMIFSRRITNKEASSGQRTILLRIETEWYMRCTHLSLRRHRMPLIITRISGRSLATSTSTNMKRMREPSAFVAWRKNLRSRQVHVSWEMRNASLPLPTWKLPREKSRTCSNVCPELRELRLASAARKRWKRN